MRWKRISELTPEEADAQRARRRASYHRNREKRIKYAREWARNRYQNDPEYRKKKREMERKYFRENRWKYKERKLAWQRKNRIEVKISDVLGITIEEARRQLREADERKQIRVL